MSPSDNWSPAAAAKPVPNIEALTKHLARISLLIICSHSLDLLKNSYVWGII